MRPRYKPANWSVPRDDVWSPRMLQMSRKRNAEKDYKGKRDLWHREQYLK